MNKVLLFLVCMVIWIYVLTVLKRTKLTAFYMMVGSCGLFAFLFTSLKEVGTNFLSYVMCICLDKLASIFNMYKVYSDYSIIFVDSNASTISLAIDYECCGFIEIVVLVSALSFFQLFSIGQRIIYSIIGSLYTIIANIIRLEFISVAIYFFGNDAYYIAHSILGRIVFYALTMMLYFYIITWQQLKKQKVGRFTYE